MVYRVEKSYNVCGQVRHTEPSNQLNVTVRGASDTVCPPPYHNHSNPNEPISHGGAMHDSKMCMSSLICLDYECKSYKDLMLY